MKYNLQYSGANKEQRTRKMTALLDMFGGKCIKCGVTEPLEFHHRDTSTVSFRIGAELTSKLSKLIEEAKKCDLLCVPCHNKITHPETHNMSRFQEGQCDCWICHDAYLDYWEDFRRANGVKPKTVAEHGTRSKYVAGCKCKDCRRANADYANKRYHQGLA